jgi:hypothetical protein
MTFMPPALNADMRLLGAATCSFNCFDAAFTNCSDIFWIRRRTKAWQEGQVHAEWRVGHLATARDFSAAPRGINPISSHSVAIEDRNSCSIVCICRFECLGGDLL